MKDMIRSKIYAIKHIKDEAEKLLHDSTNMFPDDKEFMIIRIELKGVLTSTTDDEPRTPSGTPTKSTTIPSTTLVGSKSKVSALEEKDIWGSPNFEKAIICSAEAVEEDIKFRKQLHLIEPPNFDLGVSPIKDEKPKKIEVPATTNSERITTIVNKGKGVYDSGNDGLQTNYQKGHVRGSFNTSEAICANLTKRTVKAGQHAKSPFMVRAVELSVKVEDKRIHEWALSGLECKYEPVFRSREGPNVLRIGLESLAANRIHTMTNVINGWASILNHDEGLRSMESIRRYFFTLETMSDPLLRMRCADKKTQYKAFRDCLSSAAGHKRDIITFKNIDLILDHRNWGNIDHDDMLKKYGYVTDILHQMMIIHLRTLGNKVVNVIEGEGQERLVMEWQTTGNMYDSGIFLMRHLETYMGDAASWNTGLCGEGSRQNSQIEDLKKKYVSKIIMHGENLVKSKMLLEVDRYHQVEVEVKEQLTRQASETRWNRINN